jgi:hypothetical protein
MRVKLIGKKTSIAFAILMCSALFPATHATASQGDFYPSYQAKIVGHFELPGKPPQQMILQQEKRKTYLYFRRTSERGYTVVDVTKPKHPKVINHLPQQHLSIVDSGLALATTPESTGTTSSSADATSGKKQQVQQARQTVQVIKATDPAHPRIVKTFNDVTSIVEDRERHLTYIASGDEIWILANKRVLRRHFCSSSDAISSAEPNCL